MPLNSKRVNRNQRTDNSAPKRAQVAKAPRHDPSAPKVEAGVSLSEHLLQLQRCVKAIPQPTLFIYTGGKGAAP